MLDTYRGGYVKALLDARDMINDRSDVLRWKKLLTKKGAVFITRLLDAMIQDCDTVMKYGSAGVNLMHRPDGSLFIREKE